MSGPYQHTQRGTLMLVTLILAAIAAAGAAYMNTGSGRWLCLALSLSSGILAWVFSSLTVIVSENELRWHFGPGLWRYRIARTEIEAVRPARNSLLSGFGIRMRAGFRLYNVSGLDAVELQLKNGEIRRIGTDDPSGLAAALKRA
jgi:hypothetical protein